MAHAVTVRLFLQHAQKKLKAKSREHAVALALRLRLI
jgi:DNA-binding CsgD family transcriptional regulator